jgi:hypothetical protein
MNDRYEIGERTVFLGCCTNIWASRIMSASLLRVLARSTILSAASCWSQSAAAARRVEKAATETALHWAPPPAFVCGCTHHEWMISYESNAHQKQKKAHAGLHPWLRRVRYRCLFNALLYGQRGGSRHRKEGHQDISWLNHNSREPAV